MRKKRDGTGERAKRKVKGLGEKYKFKWKSGESILPNTEESKNFG